MDDELLQDFITEANEHLSDIETDLLTIEVNGENVNLELVNKVFRAAHSIKGGSGFFGLENVKELAHKAETVLDMLRAEKMFSNAEVTNVLLSAFDQLRDMINNPGESEEADISELVIALNGLASSYLPAEQKESLTSKAVLTSAKTTAETILPQVDVDRSKRTGQYIYRVKYDLIHDIEKQGITVLKLFNSLCEKGEILDSGLDFDAVGSLDDEIGNQLPFLLIYAVNLPPKQAAELLLVDVERIEQLSTLPTSPKTATEGAHALAPMAPEPQPNVTTSPQPAKPKIAPASTKPEPPPVKSKAAVEETLRISVTLLENLMTLAGELVLGRNQLHAAITKNNPQALAVADQHLNHVTSELQDAIMQTRLQPIGNVFSKFTRVVRDMAKALEKEIQIDIRGKDVELDRSLIEGLSDPLTHMVRNAVDHGLETPDARLQCGKKPGGTLIIDARHEAGKVVVEISDDGRGIDPEKIAQSALTKGLISTEKLQAMNAQDKLALIFMPGLSTVAKVSEFSGRGVGMDVVKTNLNQLGGQVEISSEVGKGTCFQIKLPLTLAIIPSLIISLENERFAIPQINVEELLRIRAEDIKRRIEIVGGVEVLLLRDKTLPLVRFDQLLGIVPTYQDPATGKQEIDRRTTLADRRSPNHPFMPEEQQNNQTSEQPRSDGRRKRPHSAMEIAVINTGSQSYGLVVGGFHDTEEIVVKPLGRYLRGLTEYAGATILGDGTVALIIDAMGLADKAKLSLVSGSQRALEISEEAERERLKDRHSLLLFQNARDENCAISLDNVLRIERITSSQVEMQGNSRTMQYRGASLPLVTLADTAQMKPLGDDQDLVVLVSQVNNREVGLLGALPVDVVESSNIIDTSTHRQTGVIGSTIIQGTTILIADIYELVTEVYPKWGAAKTVPTLATETQSIPDSSSPAPSQATTLLLAEDSDFFRNQVQRYLEEAGYHVLAASDGQAAWEMLLENIEQVSLVVTDIEMPRLNGLELAQRIRSDSNTASLPVIAVSSLAGEEDRERGKAAGVDEYQVKLDRDSLVDSIHRLLAK